MTVDLDGVYMTYDWEGTRTRRIRKLKFCLAVMVPVVIGSLGALHIGW